MKKYESRKRKIKSLEIRILYLGRGEGYDSRMSRGEMVINVNGLDKSMKTRAAHGY